MSCNLKKNILFTSIFCVCILTYFPTRAQETEEITLADAIRLGLANNFDIQISQLNTEIAENNNTWGQAGRYPTINLNVSQNNNFRDVSNPASFLQGLSISNDVSPSITVNWTIFNGFAVSINRKRLQLLQEQSFGNAAIVVENTIQAIVLAYYNALLEKERLSVLGKVLTLSRDRYAYAELKGELGSAVTFDILQEKNAYLTDSSSFVTQEVNYQNAKRNLNLLLGEDLSKLYEFTDSLAVSTGNYAIEDLYEKMVANNSNLKNQYLNQQIFMQETRLAKTELFPRLNLGLGASYNIGRQDLSNAELSRPIDDPISSAKTLNYFANFTLSYTLFDGGRIKRTIQNAYVNEKISQVETDQLKASLENELVSVYDLYNARKKLLDISALNLSTGELNLSLAEDRYKIGTINSFDYRTIQINYLNIALDNLQAKYNLIESETDLTRLTGGIVDDYDSSK